MAQRAAPTVKKDIIAQNFFLFSAKQILLTLILTPFIGLEAAQKFKLKGDRDGQKEAKSQLLFGLNPGPLDL